MKEVILEEGGNELLSVGNECTILGEIMPNGERFYGSRVDQKFFVSHVYPNNSVGSFTLHYYYRKAWETGDGRNHFTEESSSTTVDKDYIIGLIRCVAKEIDELSEL